MINKLGLQDTLVLLTYDCYNPLGWLYTSTKSQDSDDQWQATVDVIYRCLKSGLVDCSYRSEEEKENRIDHFIQTLAENGPDDLDSLSLPDIIWFQDVCLTDYGKELVSKYDLINTPYREVLCVPFMEEIERIFDANGVPLSKYPLIPIKKSK